MSRYASHHCVEPIARLAVKKCVALPTTVCMQISDKLLKAQCSNKMKSDRKEEKVSWSYLIKCSVTVNNKHTIY